MKILDDIKAKREAATLGPENFYNDRSGPVGNFAKAAEIGAFARRMDPRTVEAMENVCRVAWEGNCCGSGDECYCGMCDALEALKQIGEEHE